MYDVSYLKYLVYNINCHVYLEMPISLAVEAYIKKNKYKNKR